MQAIGMVSQKVYATGKNKEECCRNLCFKYPGTKPGSEKSIPRLQIYPEPLYFDYTEEADE